MFKIFYLHSQKLKTKATDGTNKTETVRKNFMKFKVSGG